MAQPSAADLVAKPPEPCPTIFEDKNAKWQKEAINLLIAYGVPYYIIANIADEGFCTIADLADIYDTTDKARTEAPADYKFRPDDTTDAYTKGTARWAATRLGQAIADAKQIRKDRLTAINEQGTTNLANVVPSQARESLERIYEVQEGHLPRLKHQGNAQFLGYMYKEISHGRLGWSLGPTQACPMWSKCQRAKKTMPLWLRSPPRCR